MINVVSFLLAFSCKAKLLDPSVCVMIHPKGKTNVSAKCHNSPSNPGLDILNKNYKCLIVAPEGGVRSCKSWLFIIWKPQNKGEKSVYKFGVFPQSLLTFLVCKTGFCSGFVVFLGAFFLGHVWQHTTMTWFCLLYIDTVFCHIMIVYFITLQYYFHFVTHLES